MNDFYVYGYFLDGKLVYVGKGKNIRFLMHTMPSANSRLARTCRKYPDRVTYGIFKSELNEDQAFELERLLIKTFGRDDLKTGTLFNLTDGGEGPEGMSLDWRARISAANTGNTYWVGRHHTETSKQKMAASRSRLPPNHTTPHTDEAKEKMSKAKLANPTRYWLGKSRSEETKAKTRATGSVIYSV